MANFPTPSQIQATYFQILQSIKPSININDVNSDFVVRGNVLSGIVSGLYGDQAQVDADSFVTSMRSTSLDLRGQDLNLPRDQAQPASSTDVQITGTNGTVINPGDIVMQYLATGIMYINTNGGTISGGILDIQAIAQSVGQIGNIIAPDTILVVSPPVGVNTIASIVSSFSDGTDIESDDSYRARLLARLQNPPSGGNEADYVAFGFAANPSVKSVKIVRFSLGLGTVAVYITTGTTNIDNAVTNGQAINRIPNSGLIDAVQAYYDEVVPLTDCATVYGPNQLAVNVTINVNLAPGLSLSSSIPSSPNFNPLGLTVQQLIEREIGRPLYKYAIGGRSLTGFSGGYIVASDIAESVYVWLSAAIDPVTGLYVGNIPILTDFQIGMLDSPNWNLAVGANYLAEPGAITITQGQ